MKDVSAFSGRTFFIIAAPFPPKKKPLIFLRRHIKNGEADPVPPFFYCLLNFVHAVAVHIIKKLFAVALFVLLNMLERLPDRRVGRLKNPLS
jgi:hypothetical protein